MHRNQRPRTRGSPAVFSVFGIDPRAKRILIPKSAQHFCVRLELLAGEIVYMSAPGAVSPDPRHISYRRVMTHHLYPWTDDPLSG